MNTKIPVWESWFRKYRGTEYADLVIAGCRILLAKGCLTADDLRYVPLIGDPRIRGGAIKCLARLGFARSEGFVKSTSDICHKRPIEKFVLLNAVACQRLMEAHTAAIVGQTCEIERNGQIKMAI